MSRRGFSLLEITIAIFIFILILGATYDMFFTARRESEHPAAAFKIQEDLQRCIHFLQKDLEETNLQSIRSFQNPPGLSMVSPRDPSNNDAFSMGSFGVPRWQVYVYYFVDPATHSLKREIGPLSDADVPADAADDKTTLLMPEPSNLPPGAVPATFNTINGKSVSNQERGITSNVVLPNQTVANGKTSLLTPLQEATGGFSVYWLASTDQTSFEQGTPPTSQAQEHPFAAGQMAEPVHVDLVLANPSETTGQFTIETFSMQVRPRN